MITLILYSAEGYVCYAIANTERLLHTAMIYSPQKSTEIYLPHIESSCALLGISPRDFGRILCTNGPTSFTATRLILSTALGIASPFNTPIATISHLHAIACNCPIVTDCLWVILPAQKHTFYIQCFSMTQEEGILHANQLTDIELVTSSALHNALLSSQQCYIIHSPFLTSPCEYIPQEQCVLLPSYYAIPSPFALSTYAQHAQYTTAIPTACYIRKPDAEEQIVDIAQKLGYSLQDIDTMYVQDIRNTKL